MEITVGTFNLNNLFSRYNFEAEIDALPAGGPDLGGTVEYKFAPGSIRLRTYLGRLVKAKDPTATQKITDRIRTMSADVLAVQEVEDIDTLRQFNRDWLNNLYPYVTLIEGNDPRLIDVGVLSKLPVGGVTSWQHARHAADPAQPVFGRDLIEVEILNDARTKKLFTLFNTHLKSHFVDFRTDPVVGAQANNERRRRQAETIAAIVKARTRPDSVYIITGDMNDPPESEFIAAFAASAELKLVNALTNPAETRPPKTDDPMPASSAWTHRFKPSGQPANYELFDHLWLSPALAGKQAGAWIDRRTVHGG
ncbi:MAG: endonuclease/exonuclease/phosphatase family protein, partial [Pseudomonadota bacterium]